MKNNYVWYASYGSNLNKERFLCYIKGGQPKGSTRTEIGCNDKTLPLDDKPHIIHYPLYFAKHSSHWKNGGVCFLGLNNIAYENTLSRKYLITKEQFIDVVKQEDKNEINIDLNDVINNGSKIISNGWYGNILFLGYENNYPVFTFTAPWQSNKENPEKPSLEYLKTIIVGLKQSFQLSNIEIVKYFLNKDGIINNYTYDELFLIANNAV